ncbi:hypothetical protein EPUS_08054 [Endocarpon pusillum Z07020]|uniref:Anaphase-promoting complex subunit 5 n=1 Tax=Endocarpon pusillum (strain Z07020 / HMAS-L-300199) TaxID=1263415 RepID=U1HZL4_ENDPU|nr:uncharacterized protein EPUS_08054 [Endocarpon pusillum Z07020]ERF75009.1 hypothetical protein EPUS_08054 [Endocarpon pusillum Z07020]
MSRYLTPSKVALLSLALIYAEGVVPTPETVPVLSFLVSHILPDAPRSSHAPSSDTSYVIKLDNFESALSSIPSAIPGRTVWDLFLKKLWSIDCSHALEQLISNALTVISKSREQVQRERDEGLPPEPFGRISRTSPLGAFIRRAHLEYTRLHFSDAAALWQSFMLYRRPTKQAFEKKNPHYGRSSLDVNLSDLQLDSSHPIAQIMYGNPEDEGNVEEEFLSTHDVERLMEFHVSELQRFGGRLPDDMRSKLRQMSVAGTPLPSLGHYLKFLDCWRAGDYASAFDNLHRYFDYTMQSRDRTFYQYALLNLAILQADFGCHSEAIPAMQEAISIARENKDVTCLNFCMSWLYHFGKAFPAEMKEIKESGMLGSENEALAFLKTRAKDAEMWNLLSTTLLSEAKLGLQNGESIATAFETIAKSAHLNVIKGVTSVQGPTLLMRSSVYGRTGLAHLAWSGGDIFLDCYADEAPAEDVLKSTCRMANLLVQKGRYNQAREMLDNVDESILRVLKYRQYWTFSAGMLQLRRSLHHDDLTTSSHLLTQLRSQGAPDIELSFAFSLLEIDFHTRQKSYDKALDLVETLAKSSHEENTDIIAQIKLLNIKARLLALCGHPHQGFSITVRAASMAHRARILPCLWESAVILSNILLHLHDFSAAIQLLEAVVPQVLECEDGHLAARTYSALVDAHMGLAGEAKSARRKEGLNKAVEYLDCAFEEFRRIEDARGQGEMLAKKATVMHLCGDYGLANDMASRYLDLKREYEKMRG